MRYDVLLVLWICACIDGVFRSAYNILDIIMLIESFGMDGCA